MVIVVMGVSGAGKTTVGRRLAAELGWPFRDADDLHLPGNIARMRSGEPLTEEQRAPWLAALAGLVGEHVREGRSMVLACSALSHAHRAALLAEVADPGAVCLVHLRAERALLAERLGARTGHFFPPDLLSTQLDTLQAPAADRGVRVITLDAARPVAELVTAVRTALGLTGG